MPVDSGYGRCFMSMDPSSFFHDFEKRKRADREKSREAFQYKVLKKYFSNMLENLPGGLEAVWRDDTIEDKMLDIRERSSDRLMQCLYIEKIETCEKDLIRLPPHNVWKTFMDVLAQHEQAIMVFPVVKTGLWAVHNLSNPVKSVPKEPSIIYRGNAGCDLTVQKLGVFLMEYTGT